MRDELAVNFRQRHDARRALEGVVLVDDEHFREERLNHVRLERGDGAGVQRLHTGARRHAHGAARLPVHAPACAQDGATVRGALKIELLPGVNQVRVADGLHVHAPQLRPAPGRLQEHARNAPERVATAHGVFIGRVGRKRRQRHAFGGDLLRGGALSASDGIRSRPLGQGGGGGASDGCCQQGQGECACGARKRVFHF